MLFDCIPSFTFSPCVLQQTFCLVVVVVCLFMLLLLFVSVCVFVFHAHNMLETGCSGWFEYPAVCSFTDI